MSEQKKNRKWYVMTRPTIGEIAVVIIIAGVIWMLAAPEKLSDEPPAQNKAVAKEIASAVSGSFAAYQVKHPINAKTTAQDILASVNYISVDTLSQYQAGNTLETKASWWEKLLAKIQKQEYQGEALQKCSIQLPCLKMHNGGILQFDPKQTFSGTGSINAVFFNLDPDGNGPTDRVSFFLYTDGRFATGGSMAPGTITNGLLTPQSRNPDYLSDWQ